jgi:drug/metabolite transporter (DMT)-like permease
VPRPMDKRQRALLALLACALLWSTGGFLIKSVGLHPLAISGGRSFFALLFFLIVGGRPVFSRQIDFVGAILAYACTLTAFTAATVLTTAANAILLQYTAPVFVCLYEWLFYREKPKRLDLLAIMLVLGGLALFFLDGLALPGHAGGLALLGDFLGILSGASFGLLAVLIRRIQMKNGSAGSVLVWGNLLCVLVALPFMFQAVPQIKDVLILLILGIFQIGLAYVLYTSALSQVTALELILVPIIEPLLNPLWVLLLLGEIPTANALAGGCIVLVVVTTWCIWREKLRRQNQAVIQADKSQMRP